MTNLFCKGCQEIGHSTEDCPAECEFCGEEGYHAKDIREIRNWSNDESKGIPICDDCHELELAIDEIEMEIIYPHQTRSFIKKYLKLRSVILNLTKTLEDVIGNDPNEYLPPKYILSLIK